jgi:hypothetical protein
MVAERPAGRIQAQAHQTTQGKPQKQNHRISGGLRAGPGRRVRLVESFFTAIQEDRPGNKRSPAGRHHCPQSSLHRATEIDSSVGQRFQRCGSGPAPEGRTATGTSRTAAQFIRVALLALVAVRSHRNVAPTDRAVQLNHPCALGWLPPAEVLRTANYRPHLACLLPGLVDGARKREDDANQVDIPEGRGDKLAAIVVFDRHGRIAERQFASTSIPFRAPSANLGWRETSRQATGLGARTTRRTIFVRLSRHPTLLLAREETAQA